MDKIALVFPGQGAQYVGMGESFYNNYLVCSRPMRKPVIYQE